MPRSSFWIPLLFLIAASSLRAQEATEGTGLEVEDLARLGVTFIPGPGIDHDAVRRAVQQEFALAGVEMTDGRGSSKG